MRWPDPWWRCPANLAALSMTCILFALILLLTGCDEADPAGEGGRDRWSTITDPVTNREFRCFTLWRSAPNAGGPAMWCYENRELQP